MKFFLINPDYMLYGDPPLGLCYLAAYLREECPFLEIKILDQIEEKDMITQILKARPEVIGITAVSPNYYRAVEIAKKIKAVYPEALLIIGGVHVTTCPNCFEKSPFDLAVIGEGEIPSKKLFQMLNEEQKINVDELSKTQGFLLRNKGNVINTGLSEQIKNLDEIPMPARELLNMNFYRLPRFSSEHSLDPRGLILTSRGCPYSCKFCASSAFWRHSIRFFSAERVVQEIKLLYKKYNYHSISISDDLFSINKERLRKIVSLLEEEGLLGKLDFAVLARANCFDDETAALFKKMRVIDLTFGFESGSQKVLDYLKNKSANLSEGFRAVEIAKKHNLDAGGFFMVGSPTENRKDVEDTYNFIKRIKLHSAIVFQVKAFPGTECWDYAIKNNILDEDFFDKKQENFFVELNPDLLLSKDMTKEEFIEGYYKIKNLTKKDKPSMLSKLKMVRLRHIRAMLSPSFLKKANTLKKLFFKNYF